MAKVKENGEFGFINKKGEVQIPLEYDYISSFKNRKALVAKNKNYGVINQDGRTLIPIEYDFIGKNLKTDMHLH